MNHRDIEILMNGIAPVVSEMFEQAFTPMLARIESLEGKQSIKGDQGPAGKDGAPGLDGKDGAPGLDGKDVDWDLVRKAIEADVNAAASEIAASLPKLPKSWMIDEAGDLVSIFEDGEHQRVGTVRGKDGSRGASVMDGSVDEDGVLHLRMSDGRNLSAGVVRGRDGKSAEAVHGRPGRDAVEISIVRGLDESRSYGAGTVAYWRGGVIRAERETSPIVNGDIVASGWSVMLQGIAEEYEETVDDGRTIVRTTVYTSGSESSRTIKTSCVIDRGVWREGSFEKGDGVTYSGSFFIAQRETVSTEKPGQSDGWRLAVKRGRDGQDGKLRDATVKPVKV